MIKRLLEPLLLTLALLGAGVYAWPLLYKLGLRSYCFMDGDGVRAALTGDLPGGFIEWCASAAMVCWKVPLLGGAIFALLLLATILLAWRAARVQTLWLRWMPPMLIVWQLYLCGFSVWVFQFSAFPALYALAWCVVLGLFSAGKRWGAWTTLLGAALYPLVGSCALIGLLLAASVRGLRWPSRVLCLGVACAAPIVWQLTHYASPSYGMILSSGTFLLFEAGSFMWDTLAITLLVALVADDWLVGRFVLPRAVVLARWAVVPLSLLAIYLAMDRVTPLSTLLRCERLLAQNNTTALAALTETEIQSHRLIAAYRIYGLWKSGHLAERLFNEQPAVSHQSTAIQTIELDGYRLLYAYGLVLPARRWIFESLSAKEWSAEKFDLMARISYLCNEPEQARKYALQLKRIPLWGREADELLAGHLTAFDRTVGDLFARLSRDAGAPTFLGGADLEGTIYDRYAQVKNGNRAMVELYLCASLLRKDTKPFLENYETILQVWPQRPLPAAFQQALLLAASTLPRHEQPPLTSNLFSPGCVDAFARLQKAPLNIVGKDERFRAAYKQTFWYYMHFVR